MARRYVICVTHSRRVIRMLKQAIGFFTMVIGTGFGVSDNLILPLVLIAIGAVLMFSGKDGNE